MRRQGLTGYLFISPWLVGFLVFTLVPFVASIGLSFSRYDIVLAPAWVGLANYRELLTNDPLFWRSLRVTLTSATPLTTACSNSCPATAARGPN